MRSRSWSELLPVALAAAVDGLWAGALAAALSGASGPALMAFAAVVVLAGALLARRAAGAAIEGERADGADRAGGGSGGPAAGAGPGSVAVARALAAALTLLAAGALLVAGRVWAGHLSLVLVAADVAFAALLVVLGLVLGGEPLVPETAVSRAVRGFALLCVIVAAAGLIGGSKPGWAAGAIVVALLAGSLLVAATRYQTLTTLVPSGGRSPAWPWLLAVVGVVALVVAAGALLGLVLRVDVLVWLLALVGGVLRYVLQAFAFAVAVVGAGLIRAVGGLLGLINVHIPHSPKAPHSPTLHVLAHRRVTHIRSWGGSRVAGTVLGAVLAVLVPLAVVVLALRRVRRRVPGEVAEEREAIVTLRSAAGGAAARAGRRLRRFAVRRAAPRTPAELVRRRYEELERRLLRAGHVRSPGTTVRAFLLAVWVPGAGSGTGKAAGGSGTSGGAAVDLAVIYELARYSDHSVDDPTARRFEALAAEFGSPRPGAA
jgi:hypothetical protein